MEDRLDDGRRIAELLASEISGHEAALAALSVVDADPDVEPTADGALAYRVARDGEPVASVHVHPDRARASFSASPSAVAEAAEAAGLRVRPRGGRPPRTLVFLDDGADVKRAVRPFEVVAQSD